MASTHGIHHYRSIGQFCFPLLFERKWLVDVTGESLLDIACNNV